MLTGIKLLLCTNYVIPISQLPGSSQCQVQCGLKKFEETGQAEEKSDKC